MLKCLDISRLLEAIGYKGLMRYLHEMSAEKPELRSLPFFRYGVLAFALS
ncbi:MAG: hypothetical protein AB9903_25215 [Vulcanimicrobiota bacterium]